MVDIFLWYFGTILDLSFQELVWSWVYVMTTKTDLSWHCQFDSIPKLVMKFLFSIYQVMCKETSCWWFLCNGRFHRWPQSTKQRSANITDLGSNWLTSKNLSAVTCILYELDLLSLKTCHSNISSVFYWVIITANLKYWQTSVEFTIFFAYLACESLTANSDMIYGYLAGCLLFHGSMIVSSLKFRKVICAEIFHHSGTILYRLSAHFWTHSGGEGGGEGCGNYLPGRDSYPRSYLTLYRR